MEEPNKSQVAQTKPRDAQGHFLKASNFLSSLVAKTATIKKGTDEDTLLNIRVSNPLHKIVELLQDIKKQKAFTFSVKGSIGLVGVVVILTTAGIFGSNKILCDKGNQSVVGTLKELTAVDITSSYPLRDKLRTLLNLPPLVQTTTKRTILITDSYTIHLLGEKNAGDFNGQKVVVTGQYNSCNQELTINNDGLELFQ